MPLNGAEWKRTVHEVTTYGRSWTVVVELDTGREKFKCICPALPDCINWGSTPADALAGMTDRIDEYLKAGRGGYKPDPGSSIRQK